MVAEGGNVAGEGGNVAAGEDGALAVAAAGGVTEKATRSYRRYSSRYRVWCRGFYIASEVLHLPLDSNTTTIPIRIPNKQFNP